MGMGGSGLQEQRALLRKQRDLMDELRREEGEGEERVTEGEVGRERQRKREFGIHFWDSSARGMKIAELRQDIGKNEGL